MNKSTIGHALTAHAKTVGDIDLADIARFDRFHVAEDGMLLDYSRHWIDEEIWQLLSQYADAADLSGARALLFAGGLVNKSEGRAALHPATRGSPGGDTSQQEIIRKQQTHMAQTIEDWHGRGICQVLHIGIGGSHLGPSLVVDALAKPEMAKRCRFLTSHDAAQRARLVDDLDLKTTAVVIVSKSFTTGETIENARLVRELYQHQNLDPSSYFYAVTAVPEKAQEWGIDQGHILSILPEIGGRYSLWSSVGITAAWAIGVKAFEQLRAGARAMDQHFLSRPWDQNMPVIMALLGIWYRNFLDQRAHIIAPYHDGLRLLPPFLQQLEMESNGKRVDQFGELLNHKTVPVLLGLPGTDCQHAFFQALHQGTDVIGVDFILTKTSTRALQAHGLAQGQALMVGHKDPDPERTCPGHRPSTTLVLDDLSPHHLGRLLALYEHKTFVQGVIWGVNSFDQMGVELGKRIARDLLERLEGADQLRTDDTHDRLDGSTAGLLRYLRKPSLS
ncbi:MAG: glucose-6-phosphate isomerase [Pseudomonadota bacterium]